MELGPQQAHQIHFYLFDCGKWRNLSGEMYADLTMKSQLCSTIYHKMHSMPEDVGVLIVYVYVTYVGQEMVTNGDYLSIFII